MRSLLAAASIAVLIVATPAQAATEPLVVIVHESCPIDELSMAQLRQIFTKNRAPHPSGAKWIPLNVPPRSNERAHFDLTVLDKTPDEIGRFWVDQKIRGHGRPPRVVPSVRIAGRLVQRLENGITYVPANSVPPGTKILRIDGQTSL